ncbi:MAG: LLM class F420-dependent oxidoreductase [Acidimicrobiia bacterium]|nr:LLM class F420-dependent oxidoreductase [Acidimicrobiia bacterium]
MDISVVVAGREDESPPEEALLTAKIADGLGFGEVWIAENPTWDTFALATAIGRETDEVAITVGPLPVSVRDPATIGRGLNSIYGLTGHTVGVAIGTSSIRVVQDLHGRSRRGASRILEQTAATLRTFLDGGVLETDNRPFRRRLAPPDGPLTVAAFGDKAIAVAAHYADRMVLDLVSTHQVEGFRARLDAAASEQSRPAPRLAAWLPAAIDPSDEALRRLKESVVGYLRVAGYDDVFITAGLEDVVTMAREGVATNHLVDALPDDVVNLVGLGGNIDQVRQRLDAYRDAGLDEVAIVPVTAGDPGGEHTLSVLSELNL